MSTFHNFEIPVMPHVLESAEEHMRTAGLLLDRYASRCNDAASNLEACEPGEEKGLKRETTVLLYEIRNSLYFVAESLASSEQTLDEIRREAVDKVLSDRGEA